MLRYTRDHEWVRVDGDTAVIGISDYAQEALGDIVFADLPPVGKVLERGGVAAVVESTKAANEIYAPLSGTVVNINTILEEEPQRINADAMGAGWLYLLRLSDPAELDDMMDEDSYARYVAGEG
jgi:glycine cleavage system H protein